MTNEGGRSPAQISRLGYQPSLDGIRALAIAAVMGLHIIARVFRGGAFGVDVFFVLSAFLITSLILDETVAQRGHYRFRAFYLRRACRLGPALVVWLVVLAAPTAIAEGQGSRIFTSTLASLLYIGNLAVANIVHLPVANAYTHVWSLAIEEQFYALWPLTLVLFIMRRAASTRRILLVAFVAAAPLIHLASSYVTDNTYLLPTGHLAPIAVGCLAAELFTFGVPTMVLRVVAHSLLPWACLGALAVLIAYSPHGRFLAVLATTIVAVAAGGLVLHCCAVAATSPVKTLLATPVVVWVGRRSYGLYLYHRTIAILLPYIIPGITLRLAGPVVVVASLAMAAVSFRFIERPVIAYGHRVTARVQERPQPPATDPAPA